MMPRENDPRATLPTLPAGEHATEHPAPAPPPRALDEYRLMEPLGKGSMGRVYRAHDTILDREVAIKLLLHPGTSYRERFKTEARAAARLQHPNIVTIYRTGHINDQPYLVEEYVRGQTMAALARPVPWTRALELGVALARGLAAAHAGGVLHRDIKPANVIIADTGEPKLLDFGLAKLLDAMERDGERTGEHEAAGAPHVTQHGALLGTPYYMAPEIWNGQDATARSDVYSLGVLLHELCTGRVPHHEVPWLELPAAITTRPAPSLASRVADIDTRFAGIVERCLAIAPEDRFASGKELRDALEELFWATRAAPPPAGSPYRGLLPFEAEHRTLLFGRTANVREVMERLRTSRVVLVAGESGLGKSSLVRAGVLPCIGDAGLGDGRARQGWTLVPGHRPLAALAAELGHRLRIAETTAARELEHDMTSILGRLRQYQGDKLGVVLFIDQLEELVTLSEPDEARAAAEALASLVENVPALRVVATVRGDKVTSLASLPGLGSFIEQSLYILRPLSPEQIRETIVGPARVHGVSFESSALVDTLVAATSHAHGGLPLLQFALSQLWEARDAERGVIPDSALDAIGGVEGALARHADGVLKALLPGTREAARRILIRLVTLHGTRGRHHEDELGDDATHRAALDALVAGRLLVVHEVDGRPAYEIAHEALITGWPTLRHWLDEEGSLRAVKERLATAAGEWERSGHARDALWRGSRLREVWNINPGELSAREEAFLRASRRAEARARWLRRMAVIAPLVLTGMVYGGVEYSEAQRIAREVSRLLHEAEPAMERARSQQRTFEAARERAFAAFRDGDVQGGVAAWRQAVALAPRVDADYAAASLPLEHALRLDAGRDDVRSRLADMVYERALLAHALGDEDASERLVQRLGLYEDTGERAARWKAPTRVTLATTPAGLPVRLYRYVREANGTMLSVDTLQARISPGEWLLKPGSYVLEIRFDMHTVRYPLWLAPGASRPALDIGIDIPARIPDGFLLIAEGAFLYGYGSQGEVEPVREWYQTLPLHQRRTRAYLIARHETTLAEWMEFLRALPANERRQRLPSARDRSSNVRVELGEVDGDFVFRFDTPTHEYSVTTGETMEYVDRTSRARQSWQAFPVTGISGDDARAYVAWLDRTGKVPGARLCREDEWERAARGADARLFSHGDQLEPDDANFDLTYGQRGAAYGPDEIGSHPSTQSPFGVDDMIGNAREMTVSLFDDSTQVVRGGAFFFARGTSAVVNREVMLPEQRLPYVGLRVCADWPVP